MATNSTEHSHQFDGYAILTAINEWERHSIGKIQLAAQQARNDFTGLFDRKREDLIYLLNQINQQTDRNINLTKLTEELNKLREDLSKISSNIHLEHDKKSAPIHLIKLFPKHNDRIDEEINEQNIYVPGTELLTLRMLSNLTPNEQKQVLGERLFVLVQQIEPNLAAKITGMFLEFDIKYILILIKSSVILKDKIKEAINVLKVHQYRQRHVIES